MSRGRTHLGYATSGPSIPYGGALARFSVTRVSSIPVGRSADGGFIKVADGDDDCPSNAAASLGQR
jgi:hypothetical protein